MTEVSNTITHQRTSSVAKVEGYPPSCQTARLVQIRSRRFCSKFCRLDVIGDGILFCGTVKIALTWAHSGESKLRPQSLFLPSVLRSLSNTINFNSSSKIMPVLLTLLDSCKLK